MKKNWLSAQGPCPHCSPTWDWDDWTPNRLFRQNGKKPTATRPWVHGWLVECCDCGASWMEGA